MDNIPPDNGFEHELKDFFVDNIAQYCDKCGTAYRQNDITLLESNQVNMIIQATCHKCHNMHLATVVRQAGISTKIHVKLDIKPTDVPAKMSMGMISADEILAFHTHLREHKHVRQLISSPD